jgi:hypothetical protein
MRAAIMQPAFTSAVQRRLFSRRKKVKEFVFFTGFYF